MSGTRDVIDKMRELSQHDDPLQGALNMMEQQFLRAFDDVSAEIKQRRETQWRTREEAQAVIEELDEADRRAQFEAAIQQVRADAARVPVAYHSAVMAQAASGDTISKALTELMISLHNPMLQESLLIPVADPYKEAVREELGEFGAVLWGFVAATAGQPGPHARAYVEYAAEDWGLDPQQVLENTSLGD